METVLQGGAGIKSVNNAINRNTVKIMIKPKKLDIYTHKQILYVIIRQIDIELGLQYRADEDLDVRVMNKDNYLSSIITLI